MYDPTESGDDALQAIADARLDADMLQAANDAEGRRRDALYDAGFCTHGSGQGHRPGVPGLDAGQVLCTSGCNTVFVSDEAWEAASAAPYDFPVRRQGQ
ncbi:hypothetical protein [Streptomyces sp. NPDC002952]|uniref:hypothetical protein n=1 Tax=Streptomyces sp. NPDC002952 TaxID=3364673 RepID=UPI0036B21A49